MGEVPAQGDGFGDGRQGLFAAAQGADNRLAWLFNDMARSGLN